MNYFGKFGLAGLAGMAMMALLGIGTASATTLEVGGVAKNSAVSVETTLTPGTSLVVKDELGTIIDTCTGSTMKGQTSVFTGTSVSGSLSTLSFSGCIDGTVTLKLGPFSISHTFGGGTDGEVSLSGVELTIQYTPFGVSVTCKAGLGTLWGILKGVASGKGVLKVASKMNCGVAGTLNFSGEYRVTSPEGLGVAS